MTSDLLKQGKERFIEDYPFALISSRGRRRDGGEERVRMRREEEGKKIVCRRYGCGE